MERALKNLLFLLLLSSPFHTEATRKLMCPRFCVCDEFNGFKRADCSQQRLINAETELANMVQILDLSRNDISEISTNSFQNFSEVVELYLAQNTIAVLSLESFSMMSHLRHLDLSYNRLEEFDYRLFEANKELTYLDLTGNKFMSLKNRPIVQSASLQTLLLRDTKLSHVHQLLFSELPDLRFLDVGQNLLKATHVSAFSKLKQLERINLENNEWICNQEWKKLMRWFRERNIAVEKNQCLKHKHILEKIVSNATEKPREDIEIEQIWNITKSDPDPVELEPVKEVTRYDKVLSASCGTEEFLNMCPIFTECQEDLRQLYADFQDREQQIETFRANYRDGLITMCYVGFFFGCIAGSAVMLLICCLKNRNVSHMIEKTREKKKLRQAIKDRSKFAHATPSPPTAAFEQPPVSPSSPVAVPPHRSRVPSFRNSVESEHLPQPRSLRSMRPVRYRTSRTNDLPMVLRYFRRSQLPSPEDTYFLPRPQAPPAQPQRQVSSATSNSSVIYSELNETSSVPAAYCCAQHATLVRQTSYTPPPSYVDCLIKTSDPTQTPLKRQLSLK